MTIKAIIVDDEERGISALSGLINKYCPEITIQGSAMDVSTARELIQKNNPDLLFLDIEMRGETGFDLLAQLHPVNFETVFVTAYHEYAIKAIKSSAFEYLLKPVSINDIREVVMKFSQKQQNQQFEARYQMLNQYVSNPNPFSKIVISNAEGFYFIHISEIIYCKSDDSYTHFFLTNNGHHIVSKNLKEYEEMFEHYNFFRIHKSFLVNLNHIRKVMKSDGATVVMSNDAELPVSFRKKEEFFSAIREFVS